MDSEGIISMSVASVVEDVIKQHGTRLSDIDLASRRAEEAATRRSDAARWLRRTVGVVIGKDLPEQPSEEEFRLGLRNGIILCNAFNKVYPGTIPKVVEAPADSPDGAALSAFQYFENVRNFLVALEEKGLPTFEASDLEKGGKGSRVVDSVLALKSYSECNQMGKNGYTKYGGLIKPTGSMKSFFKRNTEAFMNTLYRNQLLNDKSHDDHNLNEDFSIESTEMKSSDSVSMLVRSVLSDKKPEEVPQIVEAMLSKVMQEYERRIANQNEMQVRRTENDISVGRKSCPAMEIESTSAVRKVEVAEDNSTMTNAADHQAKLIDEESSKRRILKQKLIFDHQQRGIEELKYTLHTAKAGMEFMRSQYCQEFNNLNKHLQVLSNAASGYHKVLEENRKLYNQVQDLKGNIRVYCRVRPFLPGQQSGMSTLGRLDDGSITIITPSKYGKEGRKSFNFNKVFGPSATQEEVFADTQPLIRSVLDGYNVCIFAYGQTGSGKTFTMSGPDELNEQSIGVNYRALNDLFYLSEQRKGTFHYEISVQMIEIYNEQVRDLLDSDGLNKRLEIRNSSQNGLNVPDANVLPVSCPSDVIELMNLGHRNRAVSATAMNDRSSRSHSCLTIHVNGKDMTSGSTFRGSMHLVDLAGSERVDKSEVKGDRLKEAQHINKSLSALGDVISSLAQKNSHVPYRNSKLTQLLQDSLGGQAKTLMFVHISPEMDAVGETLSTLKFAERVASVELGAAKLNKDSGDVKELKEQIAQLKAALARKEGESEPLRSTMSSPDMFRMKNNCIESSAEDLMSNHRQPMEDVGNLEARGNSALRQKKPNFDLQQILMSADDTEIGSQNWVDKIMVNKLESTVRDDSIRDDESIRNDFFYQRYLPDTRKEIPEFDTRRNRFDYDSDDSEMATSNSSEVDMHYQFSLPKAFPRSNMKQPKSKISKSPDITRTASNSHIPSPSRKVSNGATTQTPNRMVRPHSAGSGEKKRAVSNGKIVNGK
ncbi:kinesin-like protein KIN-14Q isoform X1 [Asparagus officinalis]|uniref:kinesin-like protein KIN-14Q isoform X1 n=1 Tax=Asparagus officinalis TaxID=4686 RepID=UPI00098DE9D1|nr:kinesin-like protein KIN-14Q isoform X1 [Asparagus officinalis]